jgi:hypothetical protein
VTKLNRSASLPAAAGGMFRGLSLAFDGTIIYVTSEGGVGAMTRNLEHVAFLDLADIPAVGGERRLGWRHLHRHPQAPDMHTSGHHCVHHGWTAWLSVRQALRV